VTDKKDVLREIDAEAIRLAKTLVRKARYGVIATLDPATGSPIATRVGLSTDHDGTPVILVSTLSAHTPALIADSRCSLLIGDVGKGDPLAHARITVFAKAREIARETTEHARLEWRYLSHQPKAKLYVGLADFRFFRLEPTGASLNGGFGKAYQMTADELLSLNPANDDLAAAEKSAVEHMNDDHADAIALYARFYAKASDGSWRISGIDAEGFDIADGDDVQRVWFATPLSSARDMHMSLVRMAGEARTGLGNPSETA
jgi:putative heme iron utilization protein